MLATGLGFLLFGCGGLLLCLTIFPLIILFTQDKDLRSDRVRKVINFVFKFYLSVLEFLGVMKVETQGLERLENMNSKLIICNHPSLLDVVIIMSRIKNVQCVVNSKLWSNPFVGLIVRAARFIRNDINPEFLLEECEQILARGENILIFPEGTRSVPGKRMKINRGFAHLALMAEVDIQALILSCRPVWLIKGAKWTDIPPKRADFLLEAGAEFSHSNYLNGGAPRSLRVRALTRDIQHYYDGRLTI